MRKYISVKPEVIGSLAKKYGITRRAVWMALSFLTKNERGHNIRKDAISMGGRYMEEDFIPNCQTEFLADGMHQRFAAGVEVVMRGSTMSLIVPGKEPENYTDVGLHSWGNILERAQSISEERMLDPVVR